MTLKPATITYSDDTFEVNFTHMNSRECRACGYPQWRSGYHMRFVRGGWHASAFHKTIGEAGGNADRIMNYQRRTHDLFGNAKREAE
jgi:hypothetical protein